MTDPVRGVAFTTEVSVVDVADPDNFLANPPIEEGDFQINLDSSAFVNMATLPVVSPPGTIIIKLDASAAEMEGEILNIVGIDQTDPKEWQDVKVTINIPEGSVETLLDIEEGDRTETRNRMTIKKKGTETVLIDKEITGSLLDANVTLKTKEPDE